MIPIVLYTHSEYSFLWKATIPLLEKYASEFTIHWCCDELLDYTLPSRFIYNKYNPELNWSGRLKECINTIQSEYIFYIQDDWLLIDFIDKDKIEYLCQVMKENNIDFLMSYIRKVCYQTGIKCKYENYEFKSS